MKGNIMKPTHIVLIIIGSILIGLIFVMGSVSHRNGKLQAEVKLLLEKNTDQSELVAELKTEREELNKTHKKWKEASKEQEEFNREYAKCIQQYKAAQKEQQEFYAQLQENNKKIIGGGLELEDILKEYLGYLQAHKECITKDNAAMREEVEELKVLCNKVAVIAQALKEEVEKNEPVPVE